MVQFMELVITGQEKLRELLKLQTEILRHKTKQKNALADQIFNPELETFTIQAVEEDGKEILIQSNVLSITLFISSVFRIFLIK